MQFKECILLRLHAHPLKLDISLKMYFSLCFVARNVRWSKIHYIIPKQTAVLVLLWESLDQKQPWTLCQWLYLVGSDNLLLEGWNVLLVVVYVGFTIKADPEPGSLKPTSCLYCTAG